MSGGYLRCCARASHCGGFSSLSTGSGCTGFSSCSTWAQQLGLAHSRAQATLVLAHGLSCSSACGYFPDQGPNPHPLHWQVDSYPLYHQGSPIFFICSSPYVNSNLPVYPCLLPNVRYLDCEFTQHNYIELHTHTKVKSG